MKIDTTQHMTADEVNGMTSKILSPSSTVSATWGIIGSGVSFKMGRLSMTPDSSLYINVYLNGSFIEERVFAEKFSVAVVAEMNSKWNAIVDHFYHQFSEK